MPDSLISTLPEAARHELSICGITTDAQLRRTSPERIWQDLEKARSFFPDETFRLTRAQLEEICGRFAANHRTVLQQPPVTPSAKESPAPPTTEQFRPAQQPIPRTHRHRNESRSCVTVRHPIVIWFGAATALLMPLFFPALIAVIYILLYTDFRPLGNSPYVYMAAPLLLLVPHLMMVRLSRCTVCHMPMYAYRPYPHHRTAHHIPMLGVAFPSALHTFFRLRLRCPACGTAQRLYGTPRSYRSAKQ